MMEGHKPNVDQEQVEKLRMSEYSRMGNFLMGKGVDMSKMSWDEMEDKYRELAGYTENDKYTRWHTKGKPKNE